MGRKKTAPVAEETQVERKTQTFTERVNKRARLVMRQLDGLRRIIDGRARPTVQEAERLQTWLLAQANAIGQAAKARAKAIDAEPKSAPVDIFAQEGGA